MMWFFALLVVLVMGGVAALASGRGAPMSEAYDDRPDALVPTDRPLGAVMLFSRGGPISEPGAELGYFLYPSARGRGVATAAGDLAIEHAFTPRARDGLGLSRLSAFTAADNVSSNSVLERLGFVRWGVEHETDLLPDGSWEDGYAWELLRSER